LLDVLNSICTEENIDILSPLIDKLLDKNPSLHLSFAHYEKTANLLSLKGQPKMLLALVNSRFQLNLSKAEDLNRFFNFKNKFDAFFHHQHKDFLKMKEIYHSLAVPLDPNPWLKNSI